MKELKVAMVLIKGTKNFWRFEVPEDSDGGWIGQLYIPKSELRDPPEVIEVTVKAYEQ